MVLKRRLDYGFNGFQVPFIPRAPRSVRRRGLSKKADEDDQVCAIEVLASLAGKLLQESESSASSNASEGNRQPAFEQESQGEAKPSVAEGVHQGDCADSTFMSNEVVSQNTSPAQAKTDAVLEHTSVTNCADCCEKIEPDVKSEICKWEDKVGHYSSRLAEVPQNFGDSCNNGNMKDGIKQEQEAGSSGIEGPRFNDKCSLKDPLKLCVNSRSLINSDSKVKSPSSKGTCPSGSFSRYGNDNKLGFRDDDENFIRCDKISIRSKAYRPPQRIAHRRIRKLLTSKYWKVAPKLKDYELSRSDVGVKPLYRKRKTCYNFNRGQQRDTLFKRRKFSYRGSDLTSDGGFSCESVSNSLEKRTDGDNPSPSAKQHALKDSYVKFSIKSFKIPELYIEVPETATVGSLKRTVMEAVMAILGGGVHVGVLLQGKKVRDDNRTLRQTGLSCEENINTLGFTLEPSSIQDSPSVCVGDPSSQYETSHSTRSPRTPVVDSGITDVLRDSPSLTNMGNLIENNHESISSPTDTMTDKVTSDSRALVAVPARSTEPLAVVPVSQKTRRSEIVQRRTRRPFSVSEVEALVQAVEELGTGRWRDVKLLAFENADYRTYVDLKDKWKTLVHTARISPQQRRGEPVPQELLDRVSAAHAFWSHNQIKHQHQHGKHQTPTLKTPKEPSAPERPGAAEAAAKPNLNLTTV